MRKLILISNIIFHHYVGCPEEDACRDPKGKLFFTYNSWTQKYGLKCDHEEDRSLGKTVFLVMNTIGCFTILSLVDRYGRKFTMILATTIIIISAISAATFDSWFVRMFLLGLANGCEGCFSNILNLLMNESSRNYNF